MNKFRQAKAFDVECFYFDVLKKCISPPGFHIMILDTDWVFFF